VRASQPHATAPSGIRCKPTGAVSGFMIRLGDGTDSFGAVSGPGGGDGVCALIGGGSSSERHSGLRRLQTIRSAHHDVERRPRWTLA
jgi:hypothetical protein